MMAFFLAAQHPEGEQPPAGALEKIEEACPAEAFAKPAKKRTMLVFSRTNGYRHASIPTGKEALRTLGRKSGAFEVVISDDLGNFEKERLKAFDAVCFLNTTLNVFSPSEEELKAMGEEEKKEAGEREKRLQENLIEFVENGGGFVGIHAATDTLYGCSEYGEMINGFFDGHPWGADKMVSIKVEPGQERHPLAAMFEGENLEFAEEIYQFRKPYDSGSVHMLLRLDTEKTDMTVGGIKREDGDFGVSWARRWGKGRVFYCSLGHNHEMYWNAKVVRHYLAGIQWAIGDFVVEIRE